MGFDRKAYMKEYNRKRYYENRERNIKKAKEWAKNNPEGIRKRSNRYYHRHKEKFLQRVKENKTRAVNLFGGKCKDCNGEFPDCVFDFHHVNGEKEKNPSAALRGSWEKAIKELEKCIMICANCHRKRHYLE